MKSLATETLGAVVLAIIVFVALVAITGAIAAFIVMVAWNLFVPSVFGGPTLTFGQAVGIYAFFAILIGGIRSVSGTK